MTSAPGVFAAGGSAIFWYEADDLGILGVGLPSWSASKPILEVRDAEVRALREAACGEDRTRSYATRSTF